MNTKAFVLTRRGAVALTALVVCGVFLSACSTPQNVARAEVASASSSTASLPAVRVVPASQLRALPEGNWSVSAGPSPTPLDVISAHVATQAAAHSVRGEDLTPSSTPKAALVYITNVVPPGETSLVPANHELVWLIELDDVRTAQSLPFANSSGLTTDSVVQWVIDAATGTYVEARDF